MAEYDNQLAMIRGFLQEHFPGRQITDAFDPRRLAHVFRLAGQPRARLVVSEEFLEDIPTPRAYLDQRLVDALGRGGGVRLTTRGLRIELSLPEDA